MVDSVNKLIANYQSKLTGAELEQFKSMPEDKQLAIAMVKTDKAAPTDLGALSNLDAKPGAKSSDGIFSKGQPPEENSTGLVIERKGAPYVDDKTGLPSTEIPKEQPTTAKTTHYVVQLGDSVDGLVKKSLKAQGVNNPDAKTFEEAKAKFVESNKDFVKTNKKGVDYLIAGKIVNVEGKISTKKNKSAKKVNEAWAQQHAKTQKANPFKRTEEAPKQHVETPPLSSTKQNTPTPKVSVPQNTPPPKTETVNAKPPTTESTTDDKSKIAKPQTGTDQLAEAKLYKPKNGFSLPNIEYGTKKAEVAKESGLVRDKTTGLFSRTFSEGGVSRTEKYDANKKLIFAESKYQSGDVTTKFFQNGKISKKVLKTDKGTTTFEGYVDDKTPTKCTQIINGKKEITKWDAQKEDWVKPEPPKAPIKETTTNMYRKGKLIRKEVKHKNGSVDLYDGYNPVPGGKSDFTLKVVTDDKGKKTYFQRDPADGDYNKIR